MDIFVTAVWQDALWVLAMAQISTVVPEGQADRGRSTPHGSLRHRQADVGSARAQSNVKMCRILTSSSASRQSAL